MKVLIVNTSDSKGGAAVVSRRLLHALNKQEGVEAKMLVAEKGTDDENVIALPRTWWIKKALDRAVVWAANGFSKKKLWLTDGGFFGNDITQRKEFQEADVIHLHWVNQGFLGLRDIEKVLKSGKKVVWTLHDMWPTTAICHHAEDCRKFEKAGSSGEESSGRGCSFCPQLLRPSENDLSASIFRKKKSLFAEVKADGNHGFSFIGCSNWVSNKVRISAITNHLPVVTIPNAISFAQYSLCDRAEAKRRLGINPETKVVCFGAARIDTPLKGFHFLKEALRLQKNKDIMLLLMGGVNDKSVFSDIPVPYKHLGFIRETAPVYQASDCLVNSSSFETLGTTMIEAQACGCTPAAFDTGGTRDIVRDGETGYIALPQNSASLAEAISKALESPIPQEKLHQFAVDNFSEDVVAKRHLMVYGHPIK